MRLKPIASISLILIATTQEFIFPDTKRKKVVPDSRFQANVNESLAEKAEPLPLGKITWMSPGQLLSARVYWAPHWLTKAIHFNDYATSNLHALPKMVFGHPDEQEFSCFSNFHKFQCNYHFAQSIAAKFMIHDNKMFMFWDFNIALHSHLEERGLHQLASTIFHFWRCASGIRQSCPSPTEADLLCQGVKHSVPGSAKQLEPTRTAGKQVSTFNIGWVYWSRKCSCANGFRWNELTLSCDVISLCEQIEPCHPNRTAECHDIGPNQYACECVDGYSGFFCQDENKCVTSNLCKPKGKCVRTRTRSAGDYYTCDCFIGYDDDPENDFPDCTLKIADEIARLNNNWIHGVVKVLTVLLGVLTFCPCCVILAFSCHKILKRERKRRATDKELEVEAEDGEAEALLADGEGEKGGEESKDEEEDVLNLSGDTQNAKHEEKEEPTEPSETVDNEADEQTEQDEQENDVTLTPNMEETTGENEEGKDSVSQMDDHDDDNEEEEEIEKAEEEQGEEKEDKEEEEEKEEEEKEAEDSEVDRSGFGEEESLLGEGNAEQDENEDYWSDIDHKRRRIERGQKAKVKKSRDTVEGKPEKFYSLQSKPNLSIPFKDEESLTVSQINLIDIDEDLREKRRRRRRAGNGNSTDPSTPEDELLALFKKQGIPTHPDMKKMILAPPSEEELAAAREAIEQSLGKNKITSRVVSSDSDSSSTSNSVAFAGSSSSTTSDSSSSTTKASDVRMTQPLITFEDHSRPIRSAKPEFVKRRRRAAKSNSRNQNRSRSPLQPKSPTRAQKLAARKRRGFPSRQRRHSPRTNKDQIIKEKKYRKNEHAGSSNELSELDSSDLIGLPSTTTGEYSDDITNRRWMSESSGI